MNRYKRIRRLLSSFHYALQGIIYTVKTQRNMKIHLICGVVAYVLAELLKLPKLEFLFVLLAIFLVVVMEMVNTAIEAMVDLITSEIHHLAKIAKDVAAGAVLLAAIFAMLIGAYVFIPPILSLMTSHVIAPVLLNM